MPVVVELLLVDEEREVGAPDGHLPLAKGVFSDLERQLQDATSHLRRKSIFGNLVSRGATIIFVADEQLPVTKEEPTPAFQPIEAHLETSDEQDCAFATVSSSEEPVDKLVPEVTPQDSSSKSVARDAPPTDSVRNECAMQVPPINRFPKTPSARKSANAAIESWWPVVFDWWPNTCTPMPCKALTGPTGRCKISVSEPADHPCLPMPSRNSNDGANVDYEAGLGGWPLSLPNAFASFPSSPDTVESAFAPPNAVSVSASALASAALRNAALAPFRKAAIEVDDEELTVILTPQKNHKCAGGSSRTPSTASTMAPPSPQVSQQLSSVVAYSRLVFPLSTMKVAKLWSKADVLCCWPKGVGEDGGLPSTSLRDASSFRTCEPGTPWSDVAEVTGLPRGADSELTVLLALPSTALAKRLLDALQRRPRRSRVTSTESTKGVVRCELHIPADIMLEPGEQTNFTAVVRRGICEACHVSADRVRICSIRSTSFQKGYPQPSTNASSRSSNQIASEYDVTTSVATHVSGEPRHNSETAVLATQEVECSPQVENSPILLDTGELRHNNMDTTVETTQEVECLAHVENSPILLDGGELRHNSTDTTASATHGVMCSPHTENPPVQLDEGEIGIDGDNTDVPIDQRSFSDPHPIETKIEADILLVPAAIETPLRRGISEPLIDLSVEGDTFFAQS